MIDQGKKQLVKLALLESCLLEKECLFLSRIEVFAKVVGDIWPIVNHVELSKNL